MEKRKTWTMVMYVILVAIISSSIPRTVFAFNEPIVGEITLTQEFNLEDLEGLSLDFSDENLMPDENGTVEVHLQDKVISENIGGPEKAKIDGVQKFKITNLSNFSDISGVTVEYRPIQNIYVTTKYVYVTQVYSHKNVKLSRCKINEEGTEAAYQDSMNLESVGHGQTLVPYTRKDNGVDNHYFLVCANAIEGSNYWEANRIGRIKYVAGETKPNTEIKSLLNTEYSNAKRSLFADLRRCAANLSTNGETMLMFKQSTSGNVQYSYYSFDVIHNVFNGNNISEMNFKTSTKLSDACLDVINKSGLPLSQLQGIDIDDDLNIYIVKNGNKTTAQQAILSVIFWSSETTKNYNLSWTASEKLEIEGIQVRTNKIYIGASPYNESDRKRAYIFSIDKSAVT